MTMSGNILNCLTKTKALYKNFFRYAFFSLTDIMNENSLSFGTNLSTDLLKLFLTVNAVSVPGIILRIANFIDESRFYCPYLNMTKISNLHLMQITNQSSLTFD